MLDKERRKITRDTKLFHHKLFKKKEKKKRKNYFKSFPSFFILRLKSKKANLYLMRSSRPFFAKHHQPILPSLDLPWKPQ
jgi:hypothetical protein